MNTYDTQNVNSVPFIERKKGADFPSGLPTMFNGLKLSKIWNGKKS